jgi:hypothetical protein
LESVVDRQRGVQDQQIRGKRYRLGQRGGAVRDLADLTATFGQDLT